ncbi:MULTISPECIES: DUF2577 domain-containing protein [Geobacillus]|uniref:DUF2577 domain-containing protein n=3 Tax=root TaxID=1 RepID=A0A2Z3N7X7_GEOTH|nr:MULTISPECIES: DUF2577 domain-containing protein [Geobacillus]YP_008240314.1 DUF2577 domain-containing protein [Thermus phage phi OH2]AEV17647.1 hypothetical protein GTCCBUS3UF5_3210 [Geobacillus thermoleovorans CCB_US3_UF5]AMQ22256.1 hypothetical protein A0V43_16980 [Geobacillus sp. JS12]AWO74978.1 DUF2577 domain-containing protein [Geobacillus thermoleovorans]KQC46939.1 hypothetical protein AP057_08925 [Geobacillus sp. Sah69]MBW7642548.1 DUF2577 domain-containing protein [Geobacillus ther
MSLIDLIKTVAVKAVEATNPVNVLFGTVVSESPLAIQIHQRLKLTEEFLVVTEQAEQANLKGGDKVILLRVQGGQQFVVLDKVVK